MSKNIYQKLSDIQKELFVPKGQQNEFGGYSYRSCEDILKKVKPLCEKNKCVLMLTSDVKQLGERYYIESTAILQDLESDGSISVKAQAREALEKKKSDESQISGATLSYSRKYCVAGLFCIDNEKDADATNTHGKAKEDIEADKVTGEDVKKILLGIAKVGVSAEEICKKYEVKDLIDLTQGQFLDIKKTINDLFEKQQKANK